MNGQPKDGGENKAKLQLRHHYGWFIGKKNMTSVCYLILKKMLSYQGHPVLNTRLIILLLPSTL